MRYAIEHRRPPRDSQRPHVILGMVWLSADEKAYLRARGERDGSFDPPAAPLMRVVPDFIDMKWVRGTGRTIMVVGVALLLASHFAYLGLALLLIGLLIEIYGWVDLISRWRRKRQPDAATAIRQILNRPRFSLRTDTAADATALEMSAGSAITGLKTLLDARQA